MARDDSDKNRGGGTAIQTRPFAGLKAVAFDLDSTLCTYTFSVEEVLRAALPRAGLESDALGDLAEAAEAYAGLWGEVQESLQSTERIRLHILERLLAERNSGADAARLSDAYGAVRDLARERAVTLRHAAYQIAIERVVQAALERGAQ